MISLIYIAVFILTHKDDFLNITISLLHLKINKSLITSIQLVFKFQLPRTVINFLQFVLN